MNIQKRTKKELIEENKKMFGELMTLRWERDLALVDNKYLMERIEGLEEENDNLRVEKEWLEDALFWLGPSTPTM